MATQRQERRLAAILAADMVGYSRLMGADEDGTIRRQKAHREAIFDPKLAEFNGRIVKTTGDGLLVEFPSAVDAVLCAVDIQKDLFGAEGDVPEERRIAYRIGINIGDIVIDGEDILGDGVNIAARLEGIAPPGGICVSGKVFEEVEKKLDVGFIDLGPQKVKNIEAPIPCYQVAADGDGVTRKLRQKWSVTQRRPLAITAGLAPVLIAIGLAWWQPWSGSGTTSVAPARAAKMAFPLPKKPSVAVLPFRNLGGDKDQNFLADGLSENIVSALSRISEMFVVARSSTLAYRGEDVKIRKVAEELGVRYVLTGSVQRAGQRLRVRVQLIDAIKGAYIWSARFDRDVADLFKLQDEITIRIVNSLRVKLTEGEQSRILHAGKPIKFEAWELGIKGVAAFRRFTKADNQRARQLLQDALKLDPKYVEAWGWIAWTYWSDVRFSWSKDSAKSIAAGKAAATKGVELDPNNGTALQALGAMYYLEGNLLRTLPLYRKAVALNPNFADQLALLAGGLTYVGGEKEALGLVTRAMRLAPRYPAWYLIVYCRALRLTGEIKKATEACRAGAKRSPRANFFQVELVATLVFGGELAEAREAAAVVMRNDPKFTIRRWGNFVLYSDPAIQKRFLDALRKAGLPE